MPYLPHTPDETREMLGALGLESLQDLLECVPEEIRLSRPLKVPSRRTETEILEEFDALQARNHRMDSRPCFLGAGAYRRFVPAAVDYLSSRGEFNTAYTPYQPEVSQGTLQAIFEYQTLITRLTGMEISNASLYEAGTALAEAVLMAHAVRTRGTRVLVSEGVHPEYRRVLQTYLTNHPVEYVPLPLAKGVTPPSLVNEALDEDTLAVVIQSPNFFGCIEDGTGLHRALKSRSSSGEAAAGGSASGVRPFFICVVDPISLAVLKPPGEYGADVVVGDGQQLGNYPSYGGPTFGFFTTRLSHVRKVPGRIAGETRDRDGKRGYVLTFQTREQHIRRARATSNICTNQGLCCLRAAMYLSLLGEEGLREVAEVSTRRAHYLRDRLVSLPGVRSAHEAAFFNEFALELPRPAEDVYRLLDERGIGGGLPLSRYFPDRSQEMLLAVTELTTREDMDRLVKALSELFANRDPNTSDPARRSS
jgi:glycine dehydrogenase subunit 1